ncbi:MAG: hypothetical protein Q8Q12_11000 [bacterium]|nr:hypothetical protein [bacterium]
MDRMIHPDIPSDAKLLPWPRRRPCSAPQLTDMRTEIGVPDRGQERIPSQ